MILKGPDGALGSIASVHFRGNQLELGLPFERDGFFVGSTGFIVQDLKIHGETMRGETRHDGIVGGNTVGVSSSLERLLEDQVAIRMVGNHDILVAGVGLDQKPTGVIRVEFADGDNRDVKFVREVGDNDRRGR